MLGNNFHGIADATGDIFYDFFMVDGKKTPFLRVGMVIQDSAPTGTSGTPVRVVFYGRRAEIVEAFVQKGTRFHLEGHLQVRTHQRQTIVEIVAENAIAIRYANWENGHRRLKEIATRAPEELQDYKTLIAGMKNDEEVQPAKQEESV